MFGFELFLVLHPYLTSFLNDYDYHIESIFHHKYESEKALLYSPKAKKRKHQNHFSSDVRLIRAQTICQAFLLY